MSAPSAPRQQCHAGLLARHGLVCAKLVPCMVLGLLAGTLPLLLFGFLGLVAMIVALRYGALPFVVFGTPTLGALAAKGWLNPLTAGLAGLAVNTLVWTVAPALERFFDVPDLFPQADLCLQFGSFFAPLWCGLAALFYLTVIPTRMDTP